MLRIGLAQARTSGKSHPKMVAAYFVRRCLFRFPSSLKNPHSSTSLIKTCFEIVQRRNEAGRFFPTALSPLQDLAWEYPEGGDETCPCARDEGGTNHVKP